MIPYVMSSPELLLATTTGATKNPNSKSIKSLGLARVASRKKSTPFAFLDSTSSTTRWRRSGDRISKKKSSAGFCSFLVLVLHPCYNFRHKVSRIFPLYPDRLFLLRLIWRSIICCSSAFRLQVFKIRINR